MKVAIIGGGINGVKTAWAFARRGDVVDLFEKDRLMSATSSASTKLLHGGLRYLEIGRLPASIECSIAEIDYLLCAYGHHFEKQKFRADVVDSFAGPRPLSVLLPTSVGQPGNTRSSVTGA